MSRTDKFISFFRNYLPSPFTLAVLLTFVSFLLALIFTDSAPGSDQPHALQLLGHWQDGFWKLLTFAMQMMLMLVLGHVLALTRPVAALVNAGLKFCHNTASAALVVTLLTMLLAFFNWGLGLIFGAIFARKVGEYASARQIPLNYPLIGAAGYVGLMVWHGGLSGSAPLKINDPGHQFEAISGVVSMDESVGSTMNLVVSLLLLLILPAAMFLLGRKSPGKLIQLDEYQGDSLVFRAETPAEKLDGSRILSLLLGGIFLLACIYLALIKPDKISLSFLNPDFINLLLFGLCLLLHDHFHAFIKATESAIVGSTGIMIQFPLYAGIMGILAGSGLIDLVSDFFVQISTPETFPVLTFLSAGVVNFFVPSGGGQWAVQGGIVLEAAKELGVPFGKAVMALAYGDQLTNMMQPFWALPLLGITGLKARDILPYCLFLMLLGGIIFTFGLILF
ncbi:MAG: short-chain fatty acid transporter [Bacteroidia bacterium]|nr:short-chain fatty acid transporter [Bacteroidia bacterium]